MAAEQRLLDNVTPNRQQESVSASNMNAGLQHEVNKLQAQIQVGILCLLLYGSSCTYGGALTPVSSHQRESVHSACSPHRQQLPEQVVILAEYTSAQGE